MEKVIHFVEKYLQPIAGKMSGEKHLKALQNAFMALIPLMTIGSFALLLISPPMDYTTMSDGIGKTLMHGWATFAGFSAPVLSPIYNITMGLLSIYICIGISYYLAKTYKMKTLVPIATSVAGFLVICSNKKFAVDITYFGTAGMFAAIIWTSLVFEFYRFLSNKKVGYIDMGKAGVPEAIGDSLGNMVPILLVLLVSGFVNAISYGLLGIGICDLAGIILKPVAGAISTPLGFLLIELIISLCWWFGIHDAFITSITDPILFNNLTANMAMYAAGTAATGLPYIVNTSFWWCMMLSGGNILALAIVTSFFTKSTQVKTVGRLGLVPAMFNISEPLLFGLPIVYNPTLMIPFIIGSPLGGLIYYIATSTKFINVAYIYPGWNIPTVFSQILCTMDFKAGLLAVIILVLNILLWFPFVKAYDKQKLDEEAAMKAELGE